ELRIVERELHRLGGEIREVAGDAATDGHAAARLADLNEQIRVAEGRRAELKRASASRGGRTVGPADLGAALTSFHPVWNTLSPNEQSSMMRLLIRRIDYAGAKGAVSITFHDSGIQALGRGEPRAEAVA